MAINWRVSNAKRKADPRVAGIAGCFALVWNSNYLSNNWVLVVSRVQLGMSSGMPCTCSLIDEAPLLPAIDAYMWLSIGD
jgi:hypothetical protein